MTETDNNRVERSALDEHREELAAELLRAARREAAPRRFPAVRGPVLAGLGALVLALPVGIAGATQLLSNDKIEIQVDTGTPLFGEDGRYPDCPIEVRMAVQELNDLSEFENVPGYQRASCPTSEELEADSGVRAEFERALQDR